MDTRFSVVKARPYTGQGSLDLPTFPATANRPARTTGNRRVLLNPTVTIVPTPIAPANPSSRPVTAPADGLNTQELISQKRTEYEALGTELSTLEAEHEAVTLYEQAQRDRIRRAKRVKRIKRTLHQHRVFIAASALTLLAFGAGVGYSTLTSGITNGLQAVQSTEASR